MPIDPFRHLEVFNPDKFGNKKIDVIGCGAVGGHIVMQLAKLGLENIHAYDFDIVSEHNIANQIFGYSDVGRPKAEALSDIVYRETATKINSYIEKIENEKKLGDVVFMCVDKMSVRKNIFEKCLKYKLGSKLMIETRMGADSGRVYTINPSLRSHVKEWEDTYYPDEEAEVSACGGTISVGPTAHIVAGLSVWQMIRWASLEHGFKDVLENEIIFSLRSMFTLSRSFK